MTTACRTLLVDAFTDEPLTGNPAGVVPDAGDLTEDQMQAIARELGASETAFVRPSSEALHRVRYFTPSQEVDLCGHATVAAFSLLAREGALDPGTHEVATNVGTVGIDIETEAGDDAPLVWLTGREPTVELVDLDYARVGEALGIDPAALEDVGADLPPAVASTGLPWLCVPVNFLSHLGGAAPQADLVEALATEHDAAGVYAFTFDTLDSDSALHARAFAPGIGVTEDPVTGTAAAACAAYLRHVDVYDDEQGYADLRFEQGHFVDRPGLVRTRVTDDEDGPEVAVGGTATVALDGTLSVPAPEDDDIVVA
ncbi:PhzF family phenazine biosynthesis protein [Salinigranum rubrum]|uniref:PhzF family phenazine biosynthesis protein n=1 Tax=Salinigranum rubrum TaxID=755307 RepID=A0A2I8VGE1_9EURY|nr:PhzF family phenazine biosynthesis protein [Salinigranum rubrum]AUV80954.1 PhzF family phenazine biosynthesis protein [Salinigranum rubrum]